MRAFRKISMFMALLGLLVLPAVIGAEEVPQALQVVDCAVAATAPAVEPAEIAVTLPEPVLASYPSCGRMNGDPCSSPGSEARCQWNEYEPDFCYCQANYTWQCGG